MTNYLEIKNVLSWNFPEESGIVQNFFFHANSKFWKLVELCGIIEKFVEFSRIKNIAYDIIVLSWLFQNFLKQYI